MNESYVLSDENVEALERVLRAAEEYRILGAGADVALLDALQKLLALYRSSESHAATVDALLRSQRRLGAVVAAAREAQRILESRGAQWPAALDVLRLATRTYDATGPDDPPRFPDGLDEAGEEELRRQLRWLRTVVVDLAGKNRLYRWTLTAAVDVIDGGLSGSWAVFGGRPGTRIWLRNTVRALNLAGDLAQQKGAEATVLPFTGKALELIVVDDVGGGADGKQEE